MTRRLNVIQYNGYYPFGLQTATSWTRANETGNTYTGNSGSEQNATTGLYETYFRGYDAALGRFAQVDPLASKYHNQTPYQFGNNDPVYWSDPSGAEGDVIRRVGDTFYIEWDQVGEYGGTWHSDDAGGGTYSQYGSSWDAFRAGYLERVAAGMTRQEAKAVIAEYGKATGNSFWKAGKNLVSMVGSAYKVLGTAWWAEKYQAYAGGNLILSNQEFLTLPKNSIVSWLAYINSIEILTQDDPRGQKYINRYETLNAMANGRMFLGYALLENGVGGDVIATARELALKTLDPSDETERFNTVMNVIKSEFSTIKSSRWRWHVG